MNTRTDLVTILERYPTSPARDRIIERAKRGDYHDWESDFDLPKSELVRDLTQAELLEVRARVIRGDFDEEPPR